MTLPVIMFAVAALLLLVALIEPVAVKLKLPPSVLFAGVGILIGAAATFFYYTDYTDSLNEIAQVLMSLPIDSSTFLYIFLPALLFQTALTLDVRRIVEDAAPVLLLAVVAVIVATVGIGFSLELVSDQPLVVCLLLGAMVATTDPVAVVGIFRELGAPARLTRLVEGESLLNDAAAITLFVLLLNLLLTGRSATFGEAAISFATHGIGGAVLGYVAGRVTAGLFRFVRDLPAALVTVSLALPYLVYVAGEHLVHVSGVVAVVAAGMTVNVTGPTRVSPDSWRHLREIWEQIEFWAASLIFVLAALLVPKLLSGVEWWDVVPLITLIAAAFATRAAVLFGLLPVLTLLRLSQRVNTRFKVMILWGGLRGAVTLALALAVNENPDVPEDVRIFVASLATGFTLLTLIVNGTTLRPLIRLLKLDRLSPFDAALRDSVVALALDNVRSSIVRTGEASDIPKPIVEAVTKPYDQRIEVAMAQATAQANVLDRDRITFGLVTLVDRERELLLAHFRERTVSIRIIERLLAETERLRERARAGGRVEYNRAARQMLGYPIAFRAALGLHRTLRIDAPLAKVLADRFERLLILRIVLSELTPFVGERIAPILGDRVAEIVEDILEQRREATKRALDALELQYPDYSRSLEQRFLVRTGLRREELEYDNLAEDRMIGAEVRSALDREIEAARLASEERPVLDLGLDLVALASRFPLFRALNPQQIAQVTKLLRPRFAVPGERIIRRGERGDAVYFISSGAVEVTTAGDPVRLGRGDFIGELAILTGEPRNADVTAIAYCQLLVLDAGDFRAMLDREPGIRAEVERVAAVRLGLYTQPVAAAETEASAERPSAALEAAEAAEANAGDGSDAARGGAEAEGLPPAAPADAAAGQPPLRGDVAAFAAVLEAGTEAEDAKRKRPER